MVNLEDIPDPINRPLKVWVDYEFPRVPGIVVYMDGVTRGEGDREREGGLLYLLDKNAGGEEPAVLVQDIEEKYVPWRIFLSQLKGIKKV